MILCHLVSLCGMWVALAWLHWKSAKCSTVKEGPCSPTRIYYTWQIIELGLLLAPKHAGNKLDQCDPVCGCELHMQQGYFFHDSKSQFLNVLLVEYSEGFILVFSFVILWNTCILVWLTCIYKSQKEDLWESNNDCDLLYTLHCRNWYMYLMTWDSIDAFSAESYSP